MNTKAMSASRRVMLIPLAVITVYTLLSAVLIDVYLHKLAVYRYERNIVNLARSGANLLQLLGKHATIEDYKNFADAFKGNSPFRVTIIDPSGVVLGDSHLTVPEIRQLEKHDERPEINQAKTSHSGLDRRYSKTVHADMVYVAARFSGPNHQGYFRLGLPPKELEQEQTSQRLILGGVTLVGLMVAALLSLLIARYFLSLVRKERLDVEHRLEDASGQIEIMGNFITQLTVCNSEEEILKIVSMIAPGLLPGYTGALALIRASRDKLEIIGSWNGQWPGETSYLPDQCWALRTGVLHTGDIRAGMIACDHFPPGEGKMICIPLVAQGETHGVLHLLGPQEAQWTVVEQKSAVAVAEHVSLTLANLRLRESLRQQAIRDPLTGLYNRRYLLETMKHEFSRAARHGHNVGLLMLDVDHFKKFNDEYGHDTGDFILSELGRLLKMMIRQEDLACRYGGEEFVLLLTDTSAEGVGQAAAKILSGVREHAFIFKNQSYGPITVSIGAAVFPENGKNAEDLLKQSDNALYEAKRSGRNRIVNA